MEIKSKSLVSSGVIAIVTLALMTSYEVIKQRINPDITIWQSHTLTILIATIIATGSGYFLLKKAEKLHKKISNALFFQQQLLDSIPVPVFYKDEKYIYTGCNKSFETFMGMDKQDMIGKTVYDLAPAKLAEVYHEKDVELIHNAGVQIYDFEVNSKTDDTKRQVIFHKATFEKGDRHVGGLIGVILDITEIKNAEFAKEKLIKKLQSALGEIKTLKGILPLCSFCKKIRDDKGYWEQVDVYIHKYSDADISHSICPECLTEHYPEEAKTVLKK